MKSLFYSLVICAFVFFISGCQNSAKNEKSVVVAHSNHFPKIMVGIWEAELNKFKWGFKFEADGSMKRISHSVIGPINLEEGGIYEDGPEPDTYAMFTMGPCTTEYDQSLQVLKVKIVLDYFAMQLPTGKLQGRAEDKFLGKISEDGKVWETQWVTYSWLEGAAPPDINAIDAKPVKLIFKKISIN